MVVSLRTGVSVRGGRESRVSKRWVVVEVNEALVEVGGWPGTRVFEASYSEGTDLDHRSKPVAFVLRHTVGDEESTDDDGIALGGAQEGGAGYAGPGLHEEETIGLAGWAVVVEGELEGIGLYECGLGGEDSFQDDVVESHSDDLLSVEALGLREGVFFVAVCGYDWNIAQTLVSWPSTAV
jgi:hypothetical protein